MDVAELQLLGVEMPQRFIRRAGAGIGAIIHLGALNKFVGHACQLVERPRPAALLCDFYVRRSPLLSADDIKVLLEAHNATLPQQIPMGDDVAQTGENYMALPAEFQRVEDGQKVTAAKMKACIKEYNATLPAQVKTSGSRDALLEQLALINPDLVAQEAQKPQPLKVSGTKTDLIQAVKIVNPDAVFADELLDAWRDNPDGKVLVTRQQLSTALAIQKALLSTWTKVNYG